MRLRAIFIVVFTTSSAVLAAPNIKLPNYQFKYTVNDPNTNDHKIQVERKVGDQLTTAYVVKTIHPVPPNGVQSGNSYIGVTRWSGNKAPIDLNLNPFINKFGLGHNLGLYPSISKNPPKVAKPPPVQKIPIKEYYAPKDKPQIIYKEPSHDYDGPKDKPLIIYRVPKPQYAWPKEKIPTVEYTWSKEKPYLEDKIPSVDYTWSKDKPYISDKIPSIDYTWSKDKPYLSDKIPSLEYAWPKDKPYFIADKLPSVQYSWPKDKPYSSDKYPGSAYEWSKDKSYKDGPKPKPIFIIIEKRPAVKSYHTVNKSYKGSKVPNYEVSYDWPKRYGHNKYDHDDDTLLYNVDENGKKYKINYPLKDYGTHAESKDYDDDSGKNKGLYHRYSYDMRYGSGTPTEIPFDTDDDKKYDFNSRKVEEDDDDDDDDDIEYEAPKKIEKGSSKSYESSESHSYGDKDDKDGWDDVTKSNKNDDDDDEEEEERHYFRKTEYKSPSYPRDGEKHEFKGSKWFHDKRDGDEEGYKSYEDKNEKDCEETSH